MSTASDFSPARLASDLEYPLRSGNDAPVVTGDVPGVQLGADRATGV
jgi:hypothetical protein